MCFRHGTLQGDRFCLPAFFLDNICTIQKLFVPLHYDNNKNGGFEYGNNK